MYFDPISAWLVALLFDGSEIILEQTRGNTVVDDFYRDDFNSSTVALKFNKNDGITYDMCKQYLLQLVYNLGIF